MRAPRVVALSALVVAGGVIGCGRTARQETALVVGRGGDLISLDPQVSLATGDHTVFDLGYEQLIYDNAPHNLPAIFGEVLKDRLVLAGSTSKAYAMTGWRLGSAVGPKPLVSAANALQSRSTSNANSITQYAALAALTGPQQCVTDMLTEYQRRRDQVLEWLKEEPRLRCGVPQGAFYVFPDISDFLSPDGLRTSLAFTDALLAEVVTATEVHVKQTKSLLLVTVAHWNV